MTGAETLLQAAGRELATTLVKSALKRDQRASGNESLVAEETLHRQVFSALQWSARVQFFGMAEGKDIDGDTVDLAFDFPRRFGGGKTKAVGEASFLELTSHAIVLGDPGAGKTTTVKRLIRLISFSPEAEHPLLPICVRFRELQEGETVVSRLADMLALRRNQREDGTVLVDTGNGMLPVLDAVVQALDEVRCVLFLDGLDELSASSPDLARDQLAQLASQLAGSRIVVTCRSGAFRSHVDGFDIYQLTELSRRQIRTIVQRWSKDPEGFLREVRGLPYRDLLSRPLLLAQLVVLFDQDGVLPNQPTRVYRRVTRLLIEEWDRANRNTRSTRYAHFDPERKSEFLAALAYHLLIINQKKNFTSTDLAQVYQMLHRRFELPEDEMGEVVAELETHNGLIVRAGPDAFEFSHLSLQEYLAAEHIVRGPYLEHVPEYLRNYPAPLAIATALSSEPSAWFGSLILHRKSKLPRDLGELLSRLQLERPLWRETAVLGAAVLTLSKSIIDARQEWILASEVVQRSVALALGRYFLVSRSADLRGDVELRYDDQPYEPGIEVHLPKSLSVDAGVLSHFVKATDSRLQYLARKHRHFASASSPRSLRWLFDACIGWPTA